MFLGSYHSKCLLNEIQNKPYNKIKVLITDIIQKIIVVGIVAIALISCGPQKPDYVDANGKEYFILERCVKSHQVTDYGYHYGYNMMEGKYNWHYGMDTKTICDSSRLDTVEINKDKKFYSKK